MWNNHDICVCAGFKTLLANVDLVCVIILICSKILIIEIKLIFSFQVYEELLTVV